MKRLLVAVAVLAIARGSWIHVKAQLAQVLLRVAWERQAKPWPWADTHPVARLRIGDDDFIVLEGANGRAMAFAPTHLEHTAMPGERGNSVISAHRDTHFQSLRHVSDGDVVHVQRKDGTWVEYRVEEQHVVDERELWVTQPSEDTLLTLVTCYPFDAVAAGGPLRYVVIARANAAPPPPAPLRSRARR